MPSNQTLSLPRDFIKTWKHGNLFALLNVCHEAAIGHSQQGMVYELGSSLISTANEV